MTEQEIIEAMPFLAKYCRSEYNDIRVDEVLLGAFNIINRQTAEIERLRKQASNSHDVMMNIVRANGG